MEGPAHFTQGVFIVRLGSPLGQEFLNALQYFSRLFNKYLGNFLVEGRFSHGLHRYACSLPGLLRRLLRLGIRLRLQWHLCGRLRSHIVIIAYRRQLNSSLPRILQQGFPRFLDQAQFNITETVNGIAELGYTFRCDIQNVFVIRLLISRGALQIVIHATNRIRQLIQHLPFRCLVTR